MRGPEFAELVAFAAVAETRSFRRAATRLGVSPSALSHTIRSLEERLGARLLNRTTRSVAPTDAGQALFEKLAPAFGEIEEAVKAVSAFRDRPAGAVRLSVLRYAVDLVLAPAFGRFARAYPEIRLELVVDDDLVDIVADGFDAGIRPGGLLQRDMVAVRLTPDLRTAVVGSPAYLASRDPPRTPHDLVGHACINYRWAKDRVPLRWPFEKEGEAFDVLIEGPLTANDVDVTLSAALDGVGLAFTLEARVAPYLSEGRLARVLEDWCPTYPGLFLYYPSRRHTPPALRALVDFLRLRDASPRDVTD